MKTIILIFGFISLGVSSAKIANAQAVEKGTIVIDGNVGFSSQITKELRYTYTNGGPDQNVKFSSFGPASIKFEYLVFNKIGVGLETNYGVSSVSYYRVMNSEEYNYKVGIACLRVIPRINVHFGGKSERFDAYGTVGMGYCNYAIKYTSSDPNYSGYYGPFPLLKVTLHVALGARYFVTDAVGVNMEVGLGNGRFGSKNVIGLGNGSLIAAGISWRMQ